MQAQEMYQWSINVLKRACPRGPMPQDYAAVEIAVHWIRHHMDDYQEVFTRFVVNPPREYVIAYEESREYVNIHGESPTRSRPFLNLLLHIYDKPRGYNGDGDLLTKMYDALALSDYVFTREHLPHYAKNLWDEYICSRPEVLCLQSRREMFESELEVFMKQGGKSLIDLGCGNGAYTRHAFNTLQGPWDNNPHVMGVDNDDIVSYIPFRGPQWLQMNVCKELPQLHFDIVYAGGLFDYFSDLMFKKVLQDIQDSLTPRFIMIGNIEQSPMTKSFMDCLGWTLFDRTRWDMIDLIVNMFTQSRVEILTDRTGHQHFLVVNL